MVDFPQLLQITLIAVVFFGGCINRLQGATRAEQAGRVLTLLTNAARHASDAVERKRIEEQAAEVSAAIRNSDQPPIPSQVDIFTMPFVHYRYASARVGMGHIPAANLEHSNLLNAGTAPDRLDPLPSSFWNRPGDIARKNLFTGFGRESRPNYEGEIWTYAVPKTSFGGHAGFEVESRGQRLKVKFGEVHSEPITARIFDALGYNAEPTDYTAGLRIRYSRRLFTEFNSRRPVDTRITALGVLPVWKIRFQPVHDPFAHVAAAVLKDGAWLPGHEFQGRLLRNGGFDAGFESRIDYIVIQEANVQPKNRREHTLGSWSFGGLGHENRRELRGAGLLAAWLGWYDSRTDNNRLKYVERDGKVELKHYFADLGGGLGKSTALLSRAPEDIQGFGWSFTQPRREQGPQRMTISFRIVSFRPIERTPAFEQMTVEDARWMGRLIAQLTPRQIRDALAASGYASGSLELCAAKLLARREKMLEDLELIEKPLNTEY